MPHKTRRQKLASLKRRQTAATTPVNEPVKKEDMAVTVFKHDLKKSLIIIVCIITLEIITYFGTMYYHLK